MEPKNEGLEDAFPFQMSDFQVHLSFLGCIRQYWIMNPSGIRGENSKKSLKPPPSRGQGEAAWQIPEVVSFLEDHIIRKTLGFHRVFGAQEDVTVVSFKDDNNTQTIPMTTLQDSSPQAHEIWAFWTTFNAKIPSFPNDFEAKPPVFFLLRPRYDHR